MTLLQLTVMTIGCILVQDPVNLCTPKEVVNRPAGQVAGIENENVPRFTGNAMDVVLSAEAALVWDLETGHILYEKNAAEQREVASISKLLSVLVVRDSLPLNQYIEITSSVEKPQRQGADVELSIGENVSVRNLLAASLIASANDAMVMLAEATHGTEEQFVHVANQFAIDNGLLNTRIANSTGLPGDIQYSTALDVKKLLTMAYNDPVLRPYLSQARGSLTTLEGSTRSYRTTNQLAGTYLPVLAAKTGYTHAAKQNLTMITQGSNGKQIGAVILGSDDRFQDMKVLVEWTWRNYTW